MSEDAARSDTKGSFCNITSPTYMYFWDAEYLLLGDMSVQACKVGIVYARELALRIPGS